MLRPVAHSLIQKGLDILKRGAGDDSVTGGDTHTSIRPVEGIDQEAHLLTNARRILLLQYVLHIDAG